VYVPPAFREDDLSTLHAAINEARLAQLVTATEAGLIATPLPLFLAPDEGPHGTLYGHVARANEQWKLPPIGDAMALFMGPHAYVTPNWYPSKQEHHKVVPTWNYVAVHCWGAPRVIDDAGWLRGLIGRLTEAQEQRRAEPWAVEDAPEDFIAAQIKGIAGLEIPVARIEGKWKASQNRSDADRAGVAAGLGDHPMARLVRPR